MIYSCSAFILRCVSHRACEVIHFHQKGFRSRRLCSLVKSCGINDKCMLPFRQRSTFMEQQFNQQQQLNVGVRLDQEGVDGINELGPSTFEPRKALVLTKISRYEFERRRHPELSEDQLANTLAERGSDYKTLIHHHGIHNECKDLVVKTLRDHGIETKVVQRFDYTRALVDWADVVFAAGGDGTFLLAASRIPDCRKPVIGVNTDPTRSEGYLCLPKKFSSDFPVAMQKLLDGKFRWRFRQRIRITVTGENVYDPPIELHDQQLMYPEYRFMDCLQEEPPPAVTMSTSGAGQKKLVRTLPVLALNEVFVGESLSSRVSYYEISVDGHKWEKQKSSGITVCTGTGSSSWNFNINKLTHQCVEHLLRIVKEETNLSIDTSDHNLIKRINDKFNNSLLFDPSIPKMAYSIRDPVVNGLIGITKPRGFARRIELKSRCFDACLVVDGGLSYIFNDGSLAEFEIVTEDALRTVAVDDNP